MERRAVVSHLRSGLRGRYFQAQQTASAIGRRVVDIAAWLRSLGLEQYEQTFRDNAIGGDVLPALRDEHLKELGLPLGHRLKLVNAIAALHVRASEQVPTAPIPPSLAMQGERRQVTVLFADLAGYTALSNELDFRNSRRGSADLLVSTSGSLVARWWPAALETSATTNTR